MFEITPNAVLRVATLLFAAPFLAGCGGIPVPPPVDPHQATASLQAALEKWKQGTAIGALRQENPPVYAVDEDWQDGRKLVNFEVRETLQEGAIARIFVRLHIDSPNGLWWKEVEYRVNTEPVINIVREFE
jgi:hypothetical protein